MIESMQLKQSAHKKEKLGIEKPKPERRQQRNELYNRTFDEPAVDALNLATKRTTRSEMTRRQKKTQLNRLVWAMACFTLVTLGGSSWLVYSSSDQFVEKEPMIIIEDRSAGTVVDVATPKPKTTRIAQPKTVVEDDVIELIESEEQPSDYVEIDRD